MGIENFVEDYPKKGVLLIAQAFDITRLVHYAGLLPELKTCVFALSIIE